MAVNDAIMSRFDKSLIINMLYFSWFSDNTDTLISRCHYGAIASPLRCNRDTVTVQSRRRYGAIAKLFGRKHADKAVASGFSALNGPVPKC